VNIQTKEKHTALMIAIEFGHFEIVKELLSSNVDVDAQDKRGISA